MTIPCLGIVAATFYFRAGGSEKVDVKEAKIKKEFGGFCLQILSILVAGARFELTTFGL